MTIQLLPRAAGLGVLSCLLGMIGGAQGQETKGYCPDGAAWTANCWDAKTTAYWDHMLEGAKTDGISTAQCGPPPETPLGALQSPIALVAPLASSPLLRQIVFTYAPSNASNDGTLTNTGHSVQLDLPAARSITFGGTAYDLKQMHFHYPSEHIWNGERFAMELHLVHVSRDGTKRAVVAVLIRKNPNNNDTNSALNALFGQMKTPVDDTDKKEEEVPAKAVSFTSANLNDILPAETDRSYVTYGGSLTTPTPKLFNKGCEENVTWLVLTTPIQATQDQINKFKGAISYTNTPFQANARPYLSNNNRPVDGWSPNASTLEFNGRKDGFGTYAQVDETPGLTLSGGLTLEALVYWNGTNGYAGLVSKPRRGFSGSGYTLALADGKPMLGIITASGANRAGATASAPIPANVWTAVSMTYDGTTAITYVNGVQVGKQTWTGNDFVAPGSTGVLIGREFLTGLVERAFGGRLADVRIWNKALPAETIAAWYGKTSLEGHPGVRDNALAGRWLLNEGEGGVVKDTSGNGHDANLAYEPRWRPSSP
jgi:carbonic anhydrase